MSDRIRARLLKDGIDSLKDEGYDFVDESNILYDPFYKYYFIEVLEEKRGIDDKTDKCIEELLNEINQLD